MKLLVTDMDNTLYDWVTSFMLSFNAMLGELAMLLGKTEDELAAEFKGVHERYGNSEQPFAAFDLPSVKAAYPAASRRELLAILNGPFHAFNAQRKRNLKLYPSVEGTLSYLTRNNVKVVAHTESYSVNAWFRIRKLNLDRYISRLYSLDGLDAGHPDLDRAAHLAAPEGYVVRLPKEDRKPNPKLLHDIIRIESGAVHDCWYVGDSLTKDVGMAKEAGVHAVWARYGTRIEPALWSDLVKITHWTEADFERERALKARFKDAKPDFVIDAFSELADLIVGSEAALADSRVC